jgi:hypothetical protein
MLPGMKDANMKMITRILAQLAGKQVLSYLSGM